jgi:hypothetical protein
VPASGWSTTAISRFTVTTFGRRAIPAPHWPPEPSKKANPLTIA